jgi:peroxiredoxin
MTANEAAIRKAYQVVEDKDVAGWVAPAYAGTDFIIARDGRIAAVYLFFDKVP